MFTRKSLVAALTITTMLAGGVAFAADEGAAPGSPEQAKLSGDIGKLSKDGATAYQDVALARLAIFDGRTADAKTFVKEADAAFDRAKTDRTIFVKAEADLKAPDQKGADQASADKPMAANGASASETPGAEKSGAKTSGTTPADMAADMKTPVKWLPVDGEVLLNEDFTAHPEKAAAVKEANKSLAQGDKKAAMDKLKLADVDVDYVVAVVPLKTTLDEVNQAAKMIDDGRYYEGSQALRQLQDNVRYDVLDINEVPKAAAKTTAGKTPGVAPTATDKGEAKGTN